MSDQDQVESLDLEALSEALQQLHIATGILARSVPAGRHQHDDWTLVSDRAPEASPLPGSRGCYA